MSKNIGDQYAFGWIENLGQGVNLLVTPTFSIATLAVVIYFLVGAFKMLTAGDDKEALASARNTITHAIIGFVLLMFSFLIFQFVLTSLFGTSIVNFRIIK